MMSERLPLGTPSEKQRAFLRQTAKYVAFGGARGGGKSWAVRFLAVTHAAKYPGIRQLIVRRTYPELTVNHIDRLRPILKTVARYNDRDKVFNFSNGSVLRFAYCAADRDLLGFQGAEYDIIYIDEATQLSEWQLRQITACLRGTGRYPRRCYFTCNPGGQSHAYIKRLFIDRHYEHGEDPADYAFVQSLVTDNHALMRAQPDYIRQLEALPPRLREAWLHGRWDVYEGQFFEELRLTPDPEAAAREGCTPEELRLQRRWTHVIPDFTPPKDWPILRSYDFGYNRPFSFGWWAVDRDGILYRILEWYGCTDTPNEGIRLTPERQFAQVRTLEREHPWLRGKTICGVADPAIWDASRGESVAETAARAGVHFTPGDNARIDGWMQCHHRLRFDANGYPRMYVFESCRAFQRTVPTLRYDERRPEDLDTSGEDHVADEWRYLCMSRPVRAMAPSLPAPRPADPLATEPRGTTLYLRL